MAYNLFKGYVPIKNKECTMPYKNKTSDELLTLRDVSKNEEYAGILNDETILIDIDDYEMSEVMMNIVEGKQLACRVYKTARGKHFLFKNIDSDLRNKTGCTLACGVVSDIKYGHRTSYSVLKHKGKEREIIYDIYDDEEYENVPKWLLPIKVKKEFWKLEKGSGRNQELFNYILTLQSEGYSKEDARECIEVINDYVIGEKLEKSELDTILRDDSFKKPIFFQKNVFLFDKFAKFLQSEYHIISIDGKLHMYDNGVYVNHSKLIERLMLKHIPNLNKQKRNEVSSYLEVWTEDKKTSTDAHYIAFKNGLYNLNTDELEAFDPSKIITNKINHDYNKKAYFEDCDKVLNRIACNDEKVRMLLEEVIGYTFYRRNELRKAFILKGEAHNGKSTYLSLISNLLGDENICTLDISELNQQFKSIMVNGKLANIGDDMDDEFVGKTSTIKKLISGDPITGENKGKDPITVKSYAKMIFSANNIPRIGRGKDSAAIIDRLVIVPLDAKFSADSEDFDPYIKYKLRSEECMEYLIQLGVKALKRVLGKKVFTVNDKMQAELEEYEESNNPMLSFFKELELNDEKLVNETTKFGYQKYDEFCIMTSIKKCSHIEFTKQVKKYFNYEVKAVRVNGSVNRVFINKEGK